MQEDISKKYPPATSEISKVLGLNGSIPETDMHSTGRQKIAPQPILSDENLTLDREANKKTSAKELARVEADFEHGIPENIRPGFSIGQMVKASAPYAAVFLVGVFLYFFFFTKFDFYSIFESTPKVKQSVKDSALKQLQKQNLAVFNTWILGYYYDVSDTKLLDPDADNSGNGLTNFQKFLLNLNPKSYDSLGLGMADSEALAKNINPVTGLAMNDKQRSIVEKYFDFEIIQNRLALFKAQGANKESVAGEYTDSSNVNGQQNINTQNEFNFVDSTVKTAPLTGAMLSNSGQNNLAESVLSANLNIDQNIPGRLEIPSIGVNVPLIWSKDPKYFDTDLKSGVIHYPGTAMPGQVGTSYISGHSSNYSWAKGDYNRIFTKINDVPDNASFKITVVQKNGKDAILHYAVTGRKEFLPTDPAQFANQGKSIVALSTCWPINTTQKRLLLYGELTQIEQ